MSVPSRQSRASACDAVVIGSGPNGLAAAITLAKAGLSVRVIEAKDTPGGGTRTEELTLPGFHHDICAAVMPMGVASPFFRGLHLEKFGLEWVQPEIPLAHPLDDGRVAVMHRSVEETVAHLPAEDGRAWRKLFGGLVRNMDALLPDLLAARPFPPRHPFLLAGFGLRAMRSARGLAQSAFRGDAAQALFAGNAAHSVLPLESFFTAAVGLVLGAVGHAHGWPVVKGGTANLTRAMCRYFEALGGELICGWPVQDIDELPQAKAYLFDTGPHQLAKIASARLPDGYRKTLQRYRYGPAVFKLDLALSEAIPWTHEACRRAGTVHTGGTLNELCRSERDCWQNRHSESPFVLVGQQSVADPTRAPQGKHTCWAYCHVPNGSTQDMTEAILSQIERFAPGFRDTILATHRMDSTAFAAHNANNIGGDVIGGVMDLRQMFTRPAARWNPHSTPAGNIFLCSSSTPPGGGVHGMCGQHAARLALRKVFGLQEEEAS